MTSKLISRCDARIAKGEVVCDIPVAMKEFFAGLDIFEGSNFHPRALEHHDNVGIAAMVQHGTSQVYGSAKRRVSVSLIDRQRVDADLQQMAS
jgi:hypothetical protein